MNKDFGLILKLAAGVGAQMPATRAAFEVNAAQSAEGQEQDFSAVILEMEKQAHLGSADNGRTRVVGEGRTRLVGVNSRCWPDPACRSELPVLTRSVV